MCSVENNPAKRAKIDATPVVDARPSNGFRSYSNIVYPAVEAFVSAPAPDFTAPGTDTGLCAADRQSALFAVHVSYGGQVCKSLAKATLSADTILLQR